MTKLLKNKELLGIIVPVEQLETYLPPCQCDYHFKTQKITFHIGTYNNNKSSWNDKLSTGEKVLFKGNVSIYDYPTNDGEVLYKYTFYPHKAFKLIPVSSQEDENKKIIHWLEQQTFGTIF